MGIPATSEFASMPYGMQQRIESELDRGETLAWCGRQVATHIRKRKREADEEKKRAYIVKYIPQLAIGVQNILELDDKQRDKIVSNLSDVLERSRKM